MIFWRNKEDKEDVLDRRTTRRSKTLRLDRRHFVVEPSKNEHDTI